MKKFLCATRLGNFKRQLNKNYFEKKNLKIGQVVSEKSLVKVEKIFDFIWKRLYCESICFKRYKYTKYGNLRTWFANWLCKSITKFNLWYLFNYILAHLNIFVLPSTYNEICCLGLVSFKTTWFNKKVAFNNEKYNKK